MQPTQGLKRGGVPQQRWKMHGDVLQTVRQC